jgi:hypothetical protein
MTTLTTAALSTEVLQTTLLSVEDLTRRLTLLALDVVQHPDHAPRMRTLLEELDAALLLTEADQGIFLLLSLEPLCSRRFGGDLKRSGLIPLMPPLALYDR